MTILQLKNAQSLDITCSLLCQLSNGVTAFRSIPIRCPAVQQLIKKIDKRRRRQLLLPGLFMMWAPPQPHNPVGFRCSADSVRLSDENACEALKVPVRPSVIRDWLLSNQNVWSELTDSVVNKNTHVKLKKWTDCSLYSNDPLTYLCPALITDASSCLHKCYFFLRRTQWQAADNKTH